MRQRPDRLECFSLSHHLFGMSCPNRHLAILIVPKRRCGDDIGSIRRRNGNETRTPAPTTWRAVRIRILAVWNKSLTLPLQWHLTHIKGGYIVEKDRIKGSAGQAKGAVKEVAGKVLGDKKLQTEGKADKAAGKVKNAVGGLKDAVRGK
jgi:uncharacterized protein YjbJ (UPF0337 family)